VIISLRILQLIVWAALLRTGVRLVCIADCRICGVSNCPYNRSLCSLDNAQVTRDGKDYGFVTVGPCVGHWLDVNGYLLVVQEPKTLEELQGSSGVRNFVCDVVPLDRGW
jgi:hypothetical protein